MTTEMKTDSYDEAEHECGKEANMINNYAHHFPMSGCQLISQRSNEGTNEGPAMHRPRRREVRRPKPTHFPKTKAQTITKKETEAKGNMKVKTMVGTKIKMKTRKNEHRNEAVQTDPTETKTETKICRPGPRGQGESSKERQLIVA